MKKSLLFFCFVFLLGSIFAQTTTWIGAAGANWNVAGNWSGGAVPGPADTVIFNSLNSCNLDVSPTIASLRALGSGGNITTIPVAQTMTINNNGATSPVFSIASGSGLLLGNGGGISFTTYGAGAANNAQVDGTLTLSAFSTWGINNGANLTNVDISGTVTVLFNHGGPVFNNSSIATTRFLSGSNFNWTTGNPGTIPAADYQNGSTINVTGVTSNMPVFSSAANYNGLLIWDNPGQTISGSSAILLPSASAIMDTISVLSTGSGTLRMFAEPQGYSIGQLDVQGSSTVEMSAPIISDRTGSITHDLKISGTATVIGNASFIGEGAVGTAMTLSVGGKLIMTGGTLNLSNRPIGVGLNGAFQLNVAGDVSQTAGTITSTSGFITSPNYITLNGTGAQSLSMITFSGPMALEINNSSVAGVTLSGTLTIPTITAPLTSSLILTNGVLTTTATNLLTMASGSQVFGASNASFVDGPVKKIGNTTFTFPVGKTNCGPSGGVNGYAALAISNFTGGAVTDQFTAEYIRGNALSLGAIIAPGIDHVSHCDYWILNRDLGSSTVDIDLSWDASINNCVTTAAYVTNRPSLTIVHNNNIPSSKWDVSTVAGVGTGTPAAGTANWSGVQSTTFGAFSLASVDFYNPLPITLNYLNGIKQNGTNYLNWKVTCFNNASATMVLERSADGRNFTAINSITADALRCGQPFDYNDNSPLAGMNYYRLKMIDANGKITYSTIIALLNKESGFDIVNLAPTLVTGNAVLNVTAAQKTKMDVVITDISGRQVQKITYNLIAGSNQFTVNLANLSAGTYQMKGYTMDGVSRTIRFVKQ